MSIYKFKSVFLICSLILCFSCKTKSSDSTEAKRTICIIGGTPSTSAILNFIPDSLKTKYNFISFNRPGFGGTDIEQTSNETIIELAKKAGLKEGDFGVIGISGGAPMALLLASKLKLKHCGIISGMVPKETYFKFADSAITKDLFTNVLAGYDEFKASVLKFPNLDAIAKQAGTDSEELFIKASFNEFNYILSEEPYTAINEDIVIDWWHGENDSNVPFRSAALFLKDFNNAQLNKISNASHNINSVTYIEKLINQWELK